MVHDHASKKPRRSRVACSSCNSRKVRCDVTQTGAPCSNCRHEAAVCEIRARKKHRPRVPRRGVRETSSRPEAADIADTADVEGALPDDSACSYIGDTRGPREPVYELCHPGVPQEGYRPSTSIAPCSPSNTSTAHKPHELDYIRHQGGFSSLPPDVCDELVRCYFCHVHFFLPVVEASTFLNEYVENRCQNFNSLLLWSMFLAATNFVDVDVLHRAGFPSRKAMKKAMYTRAKCFYDLDHGTDKITLIQSVLLMSFWYSDAQDHTGAWYWVGIAVTLAQGMGIHRCTNAQSRHPNRILSEERHRLTRRLWWACVVRDRWLSLAKGRPMRIHDEDCDVALPCTRDLLDEFEVLSAHATREFIPPGVDGLADMWVQLVRVSAALGRIMRTHYRLKGPKPGVEDIDELAADLDDCQPGATVGIQGTSDVLLLHEYHLQLFYQASVTVLYRPYFLNAPSSFPENSSTAWQQMVRSRVRTAASATNNVVEKIVEMDAVKFIKPMVITSLIPAMQIHLFDCKSSSPLQASLGQNRLQLCLLLLASLRDTYWSAGVMYRLFDGAQSILINKGNDNSTTRQNDTNQRPATQDQTTTGHATDRRMSSLVTFPPDTSVASIPGNEFMPNSESRDFNNWEHLFSPGFSLPDDLSQVFFTEYTTGVVEGEGPISSGMMFDLPMPN